MLDSKFFITLAGIIIAVFAICNTNMSSNINEGWEGVIQRRAMKNNTEPSVVSSYNLSGRYNAPQNAKNFSTNVGANLRQSIKSKRLACGCMSDCIGKCRMPYTNEVLDDSFLCGDDTGVEVLQEDTLDALSENGNQYNYERLTFANLKSRHLAHGDMLRGDLPVCKTNKTGWFKSHIGTEALHSGALLAMGGVCNETAKATAIVIGSEQVRSTYGGVDMDDALIQVQCDDTDVSTYGAVNENGQKVSAVAFR